MIRWTLDPTRDVPCWRASGGDVAVIAAFSTRRGGCSLPPYDTLNTGRSTADDPAAVEHNRIRLLQALALDPLRLATAGQVHGAAVARVTRAGLHSECDALVTTAIDLPLAVSAADCLPILYCAPGAVAAAHSGWRGTARGIAIAALEALCTASGAAPADVTVHLGPGIRGCCYDVGAEVADRFPVSAVSPHGDMFRLDIPTVIRLQLLEAGMSEHRIHDVGACTMCEPYWYFSHRRDAGHTGRHWGVIARRESP